MNTNAEYQQRHVVVNGPNERRETVTEVTQEEPREVTFSPVVIWVIALLAALAIMLTIYVVNNRNANDEANRQAMLQASQANSEQPQPPTVVQPPAQQPPIIIQPPAPVQQAPAVIQQPPIVQDKSNVLDDSTIQDAATKRLTDESDLSPVSVIVINGRATLIGVVSSIELKMKAEKVVKSVRGVKSIENKIIVSNP